MSKRISNLASSLRQIGDIQVNDWDFMSLLNKDIREFEISNSLRRFGNTRVMDWDFRTVIPVVNKLANQEIDVVELVKRAAHYKVMDWDFRNPSPEAVRQTSEHTASSHPISAEVQDLIQQLKSFLYYLVTQLTDEPQHARIRIEKIENNVFRFKVLLVKRDVAMFIGREGHTVSAIRSLLKASAGSHGVHILLEICSRDIDSALP